MKVTKESEKGNKNKGRKTTTHNNKLARSLAAGRKKSRKM